ncbi:MAG TPA: UMP kinase [Planctomycetota bacterium]|nr:UMP kinase [Planctomycetota bacterium]
MPRFKPVYKRVLLKLSGDVMRGPHEAGIDGERVRGLAAEVAEVAAAGVSLGVVIGGGNFIRGTQCSKWGIDRSTADYMGMLSTIINALALQDAIERLGTPTRVLSALECRAVCEPYIRRRALRHLERGRVVILAGGTGNPYFSTDTTAALRACELGAEVLLKATKVNGVYSADPVKDPRAVRYSRLSYMEVLQRDLRVMDLTAISLCKDNRMPLVVFSLREPGNIRRAVCGEDIGTVVGDAEAPRPAASGRAKRK